jgi:hypothetical protein
MSCNYIPKLASQIEINVCTNPASVGCTKLQTSHLEESVYSVETLIYFLFRWVFGESNIYFFFTTVQPALGAHPAPIIMRLGHGIDQSPMSSAEVKKGHNSTSTSLLCLRCHVTGRPLLNTQLYTLRCALFWEITQSITAVLCRLLGHPLGPIFKDWPLKIWPICCPEMSLKNAWIWDG